jgi:hypothetical protein
MKRTIAIAITTVGVGMALSHAIDPARDVKTPQARDNEIARQYAESHKQDLRNYKIGADAVSEDPSAGDAIVRAIEKGASKDLLP